MNGYELGPNEAVILQEINVNTDGTKVDLILTSENIIQITKGFFGGVKEVCKYPLKELTVDRYWQRNGFLKRKIRYLRIIHPASVSILPFFMIAMLSVSRYSSSLL